MRAAPNLALMAVICFGLLSSIWAGPPEPDPREPASDTTEGSRGSDAAAPAFESIDYDPATDIILTEIILSPEGVIALDTGSLEWYYDFKVGSFVEGQGPGSRGRRTDYRTGAGAVRDIAERCTEQRWIGTLEKSVLIGYDEFVEGDIIAYGRVTIRGWVQGDVKSISGRVLITESGQVDGDVEAPRVVEKQGAVVLGTVTQSESPLDLDDFTPDFSGDGLVVATVFTVVLMFFCFLLVSLMPAQVIRMQDCISKHGVKTSALGFLFLFLMPIVIALVAITIVGLIAVPFIPLFYLGAFVLGEVIFGNRIGRMVSKRFLGGPKSMLFESVLGVFLHMSMWILVAILMGQQSEVAEGFGIVFLVLSILITTFPVLSGLGAAILTRFGFRDYVGWKYRHGSGSEAMAPAPPPIRPAAPVDPPDTPRPPDDAKQSEPRDEPN